MLDDDQIETITGLLALLRRPGMTAGFDALIKAINGAEVKTALLIPELEKLLAQVPPAEPLTIKVQAEQGTTTGSVTVTWLPVSGTVTAYSISRNGVDRSGYGAWGTDTSFTTHTFDKLMPSTTYEFTVTAYNGAMALATGKVSLTTPADPVDPQPPTTGRRLPKAGLSGTRTNVILFKSGVDDLAGLGRWEDQYGVRLDGLMRFVPRANEGEMLSEVFWNQMGQIAATGRITVIALPWAPESVGAGMNARVAKGDFDAFHAKLGALAVKYNLNRPNVVFRLCWEYNGNWYHWSTVNGGIGTFKSAWMRTVDNFRRAGVHKALWWQTPNKGPQANNRTTGAEVFIDGYVDGVGLDHYNSWPPQNDDAGWNTAISQIPGLKSQTALARDKGTQWSLDENGPWNPASANVGGGDGQGYADRMTGFIADNAENNAFVTIYDDNGAPATLRHSFADNPNWRRTVLAAMKGIWK